MPEQNLAAVPLPYVPDDLVVGLPSVDLVTAELDTLGIGTSRVRTSKGLGLALLKVSADSAVLAAMRGHALAVAGARPAPREDAPLLDQLLWALRRVFTARYAGWTPLLGKNRLVGRVHGAGEVSYGGGSDPVPLGAPATLHERGAGPGSGVRVGVLDTGLYAQPWLAGGWAARYGDLLRGSGTPLYPEGHATFITGLVLSQAPGATVEVRRVLGADGTVDSWTVAEQIVAFGNSGLDVLNLSFVCYTEDGEAPLVLATAVDRLGPELVVVAAAGNHGAVDVGDDEENARERLRPAWPAALDAVVAVGATDGAGKRSLFSPDAPWVDVLAPGEALKSTYLASASKGAGDESVVFDGWASWQGTSFAAALLSGTIAASTQPGRTTSREALRDILDARPTYLELDTW